MNGEEIVYARKKGTTWSIPAVLGVGNGFLGLAVTADPEYNDQVDDSLGQLFAVESTPGSIKLDTTIPFYERFNDAVIWGMIAEFMGTAGAPTAHAAGTLSKDHVLKLAKSTVGLFSTFGANLGGAFIEEVPSLKITKMVTTWETGKPVHTVLSGPGFDLITDSTTNTLITAAGITILERKNRSYMSQTEIRMNDQSAIALASGDKIGPSKVVLTTERKQTGQPGTYVSSGRDAIDEPTNDGQLTSSISMTFPRVGDATGRAKIRANTSQKCEIITTGPMIEGAIPYLIRRQFTNLVPKKNSNPHKSGNIELTKEFVVMGADTAPAGMTGNTDPFWIFLTNKIATDLLAA